MLVGYQSMIIGAIPAYLGPYGKIKIHINYERSDQTPKEFLRFMISLPINLRTCKIKFDNFEEITNL